MSKYPLARLCQILLFSFVFIFGSIFGRTVRVDKSTYETLRTIAKISEDQRLRSIKLNDKLTTEDLRNILEAAWEVLEVNHHRLEDAKLEEIVRSLEKSYFSTMNETTRSTREPLAESGEGLPKRIWSGPHFRKIYLREKWVNGRNEICVKAPDALPADYCLTLPDNDGDPDQCLYTDGNGNLSWGACGSGGSGHNPVSIAAGSTNSLSITTAQVLSIDPTLNSFSTYNTNGLITQTAPDTFTGRTIQGTTNQVNVANGNGVAGNPTLSLPQNIAPTSSPTFATVNATNFIGNLTGNADTATTATNFSGSLSGDVTGTQSTTVVSLVGGKTATQVANATTDVQNATSSNTPNTIVERDGSGNFAAGTITANLTGSASLNVLKTGDTMTGTLYYSGSTGIDSTETGSGDILNVGATNANIVNMATGNDVQTVNIGTGSGTTTINIGAPGDTINIQGTLTTVDSTTTQIADPILFLNTGASSAAGSGIAVEDSSGTQSGYLKVSGDSASWILKAPGTGGAGGTVTFSPGTSSLIINQSSHDPVTLGTANGLSLSVQQLSLGTASSTTTGALTSTDWNTFNNKGDILNGGQTGPITIGTNDSTNLYFETNNTTRMTVQSGGNVNIATNLDLPNTTATTGIIYKVGTPFIHNFGFNNTFVGESAGNLTMSGSDNTAVGKFALSSNTSGEFNVALGTRSMEDNVNGGYNVAIGYDTLADNTSGAFNLAAGHNSMRSNSTGYSNVALGGEALYNSTGNYNIGVGYRGGFNLTTGTKNICVGNQGVAGESNTIRLGNSTDHSDCYIAGIRGVSVTGGQIVEIDANGKLGTTTIAAGDIFNGGQTGPITIGTNDPTNLYFETNNNTRMTVENTGNINIATNLVLPGATAATGVIYMGLPPAPFIHNFGTNNTFMGAFAGNLGTGGTDNTAVGKDALSSSGTGNFNVALGACSMEDTLNGDRNVAVGYRALANNTSGSNNLAAGDNSMPINLIGNANVALGGETLYNSTGGYNIAVGYRSGYSLTNGTKNICIGNSGVAAESNTIRLGNSTDHLDCYIAGIRGVTVTGGQIVEIDANGKLGTTTIAGGGDIFNGGQTGPITIGTNDSTNIYFETNNTTRMTVESGGNVNIATNLELQDTTATTGIIYKGGTPFIHNFGTTPTNTFMGKSAGNLTMTGIGNNTAVGYSSFSQNTTGSNNSAFGYCSLNNSTIGGANTAIGRNALRNNTDGNANTAIGAFSLWNNITGEQNTAVGTAALQNLTTGLRNIAIGFDSSQNYSTDESNNICIGNQGVAGESNTIRLGNSTDHLDCYIAGIRGVTTGVANAISVLIDSNGQLGTVSSSARFKENIEDISKDSHVMDLRPVTFNYKEDKSKTTQYGLIAEEVEKIMPELVVHDEEGLPYTVKYHLLSSLLLNELKKNRSIIEQLAEKVAVLEASQAG